MEPALTPRKADAASMRFGSRAIHAGNEMPDATRAVLPPLVMANSYEIPADPANLDWDDMDTPAYSRTTGANQLALQRKLAVLEEGAEAVVLASGVAALHAVFFSYLKSGDHVLVGDVTYESTWRLLTELLPQKYGIQSTMVDTSDLTAVGEAMRPNTKMIVAETIANPTTRVADVAALANLAHTTGALLAVDSTFTPPPLYRPLRDGADFVIHSLTKYINGHGDAMGGAVIGSPELIRPLKLDAMVDLGATISPFNAWLINRGIMTLPLRLRQHLAGAKAIAEFLADDPRVAYVVYPGLPTHPQHELAARQFTDGFGATLAFAAKGDHSAQTRLVSALRLITSAVSLGHPETLIYNIDTDGPRGHTYPQEFRQYGHLRLAVGLEDPIDLIADLTQALDAAVGSV